MNVPQCLNEKRNNLIHQIEWSELIGHEKERTAKSNWKLRKLKPNLWNQNLEFSLMKLGLSCLLVVVCWMNPEFIAPKHPSGFNQPTSNKPNFLPQVLVCVVIGNSSILTGSSNLSVPAIMHRDASYSSFTVLVRYWLILYVLAYCYNNPN